MTRESYSEAGAVGTPKFYAARDQRTRASEIRSHDRRRLRSSASAEAARRFAGSAARRVSTAWLSRRLTCGTSDVRDLLRETKMPPRGRPLVLLRLTVGE
jgi:hypothetical protein